MVIVNIQARFSFAAKLLGYLHEIKFFVEIFYTTILFGFSLNKVYICAVNLNNQREMICPLANVEEVFKTENGAVYQCSRKNCYWLEFQDSTTSFSVSDFFLFKRRIDSIDIEQMLCDSSRSSDFEIIMPYRTERCFMLTVADILNLREVLDGAKFMIELNGQIKSIMRRGAICAF